MSTCRGDDVGDRWRRRTCSPTDAWGAWRRRLTALVPLVVLLGGVPAPARESGVVLFLGDSLTAGLGVDREFAYPALVQQRIDAAGLDYRVVNAGVSGETSAGGLRRVSWLLRQSIDVLVLELGANDALRGTDLTSTRANLQAIIDAVRRTYPEVRIVIAGMQVPPNLGPEYTREFRAIYPQLARANDATLIPFLLAGVGGQPQLNQADGIHPTAAGHTIVADNVWAILGPLLARDQAPDSSSPTSRSR